MVRKADLAALVEAAKERGRLSQDSRPHAVSAFYDDAQRLVFMALRNGVVFGVPPHLLQGLESATPEQLDLIEVSPQGALLHWPALDVSHGVANLVEGVFGASWWVSDRAARAGRVKSAAKAAAARTNGAKGGRPRKVREAVLEIGLLAPKTGSRADSKASKI